MFLLFIHVCISLFPVTKTAWQTMSLFGCLSLQGAPEEGGVGLGGGGWEVFMTWANNLPARAGSPKQISQRGASFQEPARKIKEPLYFHLQALEFVFCNEGKVKLWSQEF